MRLLICLLFLIVPFSANALHAKCMNYDGHIMFQGPIKGFAFTDDFFVVINKKNHTVYIFGDCIFED